MEMTAKGNTASRSKEKPFPERKTKKVWGAVRI